MIDQPGNGDTAGPSSLSFESHPGTVWPVRRGEAGLPCWMSAGHFSAAAKQRSLSHTLKRTLPLPWLPYPHTASAPEPRVWLSFLLSMSTCPACTDESAVCADGCLDAMIGDGSCNMECNNTACNFDEDDCRFPTKATVVAASDPAVPIRI